MNYDHVSREVIGSVDHDYDDRLNALSWEQAEAERLRTKIHIAADPPTVRERITRFTVKGLPADPYVRGCCSDVVTREVVHNDEVCPCHESHGHGVVPDISGRDVARDWHNDDHLAGDGPVRGSDPWARGYRAGYSRAISDALTAWDRNR